MKTWLLNNSLWLIGLGLMLASSGIDGAYMAQWMTVPTLGYILNTVSDVAGMVIMYWFGRLRQGTKVQRNLSWVLLGSEIITVCYSWFFSYLQLRRVLISLEGESADAIAKVAAGFIPLLLAFVGYAQSLLEGKLKPVEVARKLPATKTKVSQVAHEQTATEIPAVKVAAPEPKPVKLNTRQIELARMLHEDDSATKTALAKALGVSRTTIASDMKVIADHNGNGSEG